jgi:hypothetical protein
MALIRFGIVIFLAAALAFTALVVFLPSPNAHVHAADGSLATVTIDYPLNGSIFPPEITPPTFIWRDAAQTADHWRIRDCVRRRLVGPSF